jgi:DNA-binding transcriptional LysR family regulator
MAEMETRELEYFLAVAEELHFGRGAERLGIAQPAVSKAVRRLERRLGVQLFDRSGRRVALTAAGEALRGEGRHALGAVEAAARAARRAGESEVRLRLVMKPGGDADLLSGILAAHARVAGARQVDILFGGTTGRAERVRAGQADVALLYLPFDDPAGLAHETLLVEDRVALLPRSHRLASRARLTLGDLAGEPLPRWRGAGWTGTPEGAVPGPEITDGPEMVQLVRLGRTLALLPRSLAEPAHPDLVVLPVADAPRSALVIAWAEHDRRPLVAGFVRAAVAAAAAAGAAKGEQGG